MRKLLFCRLPINKKVKMGSAGNPSKYKQKTIKIPREYQQNTKRVPTEHQAGPGPGRRAGPGRRQPGWSGRRCCWY